MKSDFSAAISGSIFGLLVTPGAFVLAIASMGGGHGDYYYAKLLYPWQMLMAASQDVISVACIGLAGAQFPGYGACITIAVRRKVWPLVVSLMVAQHALGAFLALRTDGF